MVKRNIQTTFLSVTVLFIMFLASCNPAKKYEKEEKNSIENFLAENSNLNFELQPSGLYYREVEAGTGISPVLYDSAYVRYTGKFLDGTEFISNISQPTPAGLIVGLINVVGISEGLTLMKVGGKASLLIPSKLAFGTRGIDFISGYTPLLYDVELVKVTRNQ